MLGAIKIVIAITILVLISVFFGNVEFSFAEIDNYITDYQYYQENQSAKFRFRALQDFKMSWEKVENDMIYFKPDLSDIYYWKATTDSGIYGSGGFLETTNELDNLPVGIFEKRFYKGQDYEVFLTGWNCGYNGCAVGEFAISEKMDETHFIVITDKIANEESKETIYFGEEKKTAATAPTAAKNIVTGDETGLDENKALTKNKSGEIIVLILILILIIGLVIIFWRKKKHARNN